MNKTFAVSLLSLTVIAFGMAEAPAATIVADNFTGPAVTYGVGDTFSPGVSPSGVDWLVTSGSVTVGNGLARLESNSGGLTINFGQVSAAAPVIVSFQVNNLFQTNGSYRLDFSLSDSLSSDTYTEAASPNPTFYGTTGFNSYNDSGALIGGAPGQALSSNGSWDAVVFTFNPASGVTVEVNSQLVASWTNFLAISQVDTFSILNVTGGAAWAISSFTIDATAIPEPTTISIMAFAAVALGAGRRTRCRQ